MKNILRDEYRKEIILKYCTIDIMFLSLSLLIIDAQDIRIESSNKKKKIERLEIRLIDRYTKHDRSKNNSRLIGDNGKPFESLKAASKTWAFRSDKIAA